MAALGTGTISLAGTAFGSGSVETAAQLTYTGPSASSSKALTLDAGGGVIYLPNAGTVLTLNGVISETGGTGRALIINGNNLTGATVALTAANTYTGPTVINYGGILSIPTIANGGVASPLGASSSAPANLRIGGNAYAGSGTLRYTGPTASSDRGVELDKNNSADTSTIDVATAGTTLTMSGQFTGTNGLTKAGPGTLALTGLAANTYTGTTTILAGTLSAGLAESALVLTPGGAGLDVQGGKFILQLHRRHRSHRHREGRTSSPATAWHRSSPPARSVTPPSPPTEPSATATTAAASPSWSHCPATPTSTAASTSTTSSFSRTTSAWPTPVSIKATSTTTA